MRALVGTLGGLLHESALVLLPRFVRQSRLYEATAKNALRIAVEAVGRVAPKEPPEVSAKEITKRKAAGNVVELGSIAAFGFSPLWLLAAASDVAHGSRVYLAAFVDELKSAGVLAEEREIGSVDELLETLENASGRTAGLIDIPPLELAELRSTLGEFRGDASGLPGPDELAALYRGLRAEAARERGSLLEVSVGMGMAFLLSAKKVAGRDVVDSVPRGLGAASPRGIRRRTPAGSAHRTPARPRDTSTPAARPGRSACSSSSRALADRPTGLENFRKAPTVQVGREAPALALRPVRGDALCQLGRSRPGSPSARPRSRPFCS